MFQQIFLTRYTLVRVKILRFRLILNSFSTIFPIFISPPTKERNSLVKKSQPDVSSILIRTIAQSDILLRLTATVVPTSSRIKGPRTSSSVSKFVSRSNGFEFTGCSLFLEFPQILIIPCVTRHRKSNDFWFANRTRS